MNLVYGTILCSLLALTTALNCGRVNFSATETETAPTRREVQRAALRTPVWQFVTCTEDDSLRRFLADVAADSSGDRRVVLIDCASYDASRPAIVFGEFLPPSLDIELAAFPAAGALRMAASDLLILNGYPAPRAAADSLPSVVNIYLGQRVGDVLDHLRTADFSYWGGIFRGQWAYEVHGDDGNVRLGSYTGRGWEIDREGELVLAAFGGVYARLDSVDVYLADRAGAPLPDSLSALVSRERAVDSSFTSLYLYPSVEAMALRRGTMTERDTQGGQLHLVYQRQSDPVVDPSTGDGFLRGMTFAHEGYRIYNGYGGSTVPPSLDSLSKLNVNAVAVVPYSYLRNPRRPDALPVPESAGSENDAAVRFTIRQARQRGFTVMLKPQIWVSGAWPGDVDFDTDADWDTFFQEYEKWILHYAAMAQAERVSILCIGTELVHTTLKYPGKWVEIIGRIREVYSGKLTYAANWGPEFEQLAFWTELDAVGLNSYYPLSTADSPTDDELLTGAREWMQLADSISVAVDRPLWLTEVGYRSVATAWQNPHAEAGDRPADYATQARCYRALLTAAAESDRLRGVFIWKWPSYLGYRDRNESDTGYVPGGKPAGRLLSEFYGSRR